MAFGDQDLDIFFRDGTAATLATGETLRCHFDEGENVDPFSKGPSIAGEVMGQPEIRFATKNLPDGFGHGSVLTVNDTKYKVRWMKQESDGQISIARLAIVVAS